MGRPLRVTTFAEPVNISDVIKMEAEGTYCRELVTIVSGAGVLAIGTVLGKITASGKYKAHVNGAVDGTEVARAILIDSVDATAADQLQVVVIARGPAEARAQSLKWDASVNTQPKKDAAIAQLTTIGIVVRAGA